QGGQLLGPVAEVVDQQGGGRAPLRLGALAEVGPQGRDQGQPDRPEGVGQGGVRARVVEDGGDQPVGQEGGLGRPARPVPPPVGRGVGGGGGGRRPEAPRGGAPLVLQPPPQPGG